MNKHTPGPWETRHRLVFKSGHGTIASCWSRHRHPLYGLGIDDDEANANATLVHAAPDLLDALDDLFDAVASEYGDNIVNWPGPFLMKAGYKARAAIAKATVKEV